MMRLLRLYKLGAFFGGVALLTLGVYLSAGLAAGLITLGSVLIISVIGGGARAEHH